MSKRVKIGQAGEFTVGKLHPIKIEGKKMLLYIGENGPCAVENRCSHWNIQMNAGHVVQTEDGPVIQCPLHGSQFDMCTGAVVQWVQNVGPVKAPKPMRSLLAIGRPEAPISAYQIEEEDGVLFAILSD